jgi:Cytochrome C oxidase, cbb3-type, subunit III
VGGRRKLYPPSVVPQTVHCPLTSSYVQHWSDAELFRIIQNGMRLAGMPAWKSNISTDDTWKLARFIDNLPRLRGASASTAAAPSQAQAAVSAPDKYTLKIPNGLAFSEFKGHEGWPVISVSYR